MRYNQLQLKGEKFGRLSVVDFYDTFNRNSRWKCVCDCGSEIILPGNRLVRGNDTSCGCRVKLKGNKSYRWKGYGEIPLRFYNHIKTHCQRKSQQVDFNVTIEYLWNLFLEQERKCALSGIELSFDSSSRNKDGNASLDRIDSSQGYVIGNVQWVHKDLNLMKLAYTQSYFVEMCKKVAKHNE